MRGDVEGLLARRPVRFIITGGVVFLISFSLTSGLHAVGLPFQFAFLLAYLVAVTVHLQLHRVFTFAGDGEYVLVRRNQAVRFVAVVVGQYAFIALSVAVFAPLLEVPDLVVYLGAIAVMSLANYLALAAKVFHTHRA